MAHVRRWQILAITMGLGLIGLSSEAAQAPAPVISPVATPIKKASPPPIRRTTTPLRQNASTPTSSPSLPVVETIPQNDQAAELERLNKSLKNDINVLLQQVNTLSQEINQLKHQSANEEVSTLQKILQEEKSLLISLLASLFFCVIFISLLLARWTKQRSEKQMEKQLEGLIEEAKQTLFKDARLSEASFLENSGGLISDRLDDFDRSLQSINENNIQNFSQTVSQKYHGFEEDIQYLIREKLDKFSFDLEANFASAKDNLSNALNNQLPAGNLTQIILNLAKEKGLLELLQKDLQGDWQKLFDQEVDQIKKSMQLKEESLKSQVEKLQLAYNHFNIGNLLTKQKNYQEAIDEYKMALKIDKTFYGAYINLGNTYEKIDAFDQALAIYEQAIQIKPSFFKAYFNQANLLKKQENYEEAIKKYEKVIETKPQYTKAYHSLGHIYQLQGKDEKAIDFYEKVLQFDPQNIESIYYLSQLQLNNSSPSITQLNSLFTKYQANQKTKQAVQDLFHENGIKLA